MPNTAQSIQGFLNSLSSLPGSILYRDELEWAALAPGNLGDVLTIGPDRLPIWTQRPDYYPALMQYNGSSTYYSSTAFSVTNDPYDVFIRFRNPAVPVGVNMTTIIAAGRSFLRILINPPGHLQVSSFSTTGTTLFSVRSIDPVDDNKLHYAYARYNPHTAAFRFIVDGQNADDMTWGPRVVTTGTLPAGTANPFEQGRGIFGSLSFPGQIGAFGFKQNATIDWHDFMTNDGWPRKINVSTWPEWAGQPPIWHESGELNRNRGSVSAITANGPIRLALPETWFP